jgi:chromate transport protein ChrA
MASPSLLHRVVENVRIFTIISLTGFGGPAANIVYLKRVFVTRLAWLDESTFADLFALSSALPGPSYLQLAFSIALLRGGLICGLLAIIVLT